MPPTARNFVLFPSFVAQHSVTFEGQNAMELTRQFTGQVLPDELAGAVRRRQAEFLAGRFCVREALRACAPEHQAVRVGIGRRGEPIWPAGIVGAITHSDGFASAAVARSDDARAIGLDVERVMPAKRAADLADKIAAAGELARLSLETGWDTATTLTAVFSAKETIFKCLFGEVGHYFDFRDAWVDAFDTARGCFHAHLVTALTPSLPTGHPLQGRFEVVADWVCTGMVLPPSVCLRLVQPQSADVFGC
jgi:enterobactin synthetase component D